MNPKHIDDIKPLEKNIGYQFNNHGLLKKALTHSSYANEKGDSLASNERLEFLGDSVLGFVSAEYYFGLFAQRAEGDLTKMRAAAVCEQSLFGFASEIDLGKYLYLGKGEERTGGRTRPSILADAFEALIAAIYLDGGITYAKTFVLRFLETVPYVETTCHDYKTMLQEVIQQNPGEELTYVLAQEKGPDHDKEFFIEVHLNENIIGKGIGKSKKHAEQMAAQEALKLMGLL